jgi:hypothetical protein
MVVLEEELGVQNVIVVLRVDYLTQIKDYVHIVSPNLKINYIKKHMKNLKNLLLLNI